MYYLRIMESLSDYQSFVEGKGPDYVEPHVVSIPNDNLVTYKQFVPPPPIAGDIAYWDGSAVQIVSKTAWNSNLGTPIGVVVIPPNMLPDGKARILSLKAVDSNGNAIDSHSSMDWSNVSVNTSLTDYNKVPTTDNSGSTTTGSNSYGYLPSDNFSGTQSFVDPKAKYKQSSYLIPSPYLGDDNTLNPAYCKEISGYNNALSDFNGLSNTQTLVGLGTDYIPANACWNYNDGVSNLQWYLPAIGELGFLLVRLKEINDTLSMLGGISVSMYKTYWSSSEYNISNYAYVSSFYDGQMYTNAKGASHYVCPFVAV
jgi:hypothetical protein